MHFASHTLKDSQPVCSHVTASQLMSEQPERVRGTTVTLGKPRKAILAGAEGVPMSVVSFLADSIPLAEGLLLILLATGLG